MSSPEGTDEEDSDSGIKMIIAVTIVSPSGACVIVN
jgi:hypothetical protein